MSNVAQFLAALRAVEQRPYNQVGDSENGVRPFGAYGMLVENWDQWAALAGISGANMMDPDAQDYVAGYMAQNLFQRYGDWDFVAAAWFAGPEQTNKALTSTEGLGWFKNPAVTEYLKKFQDAMQQPEVQYSAMPRAAGQWINPQGVPKGWLMPVAGPNEYSNSFLVKRTNNKTGIHGAIDIYAKKGTPIVAPVGGKVLSVRYSDIGGYTARILGDDGLTYYFAHMDGDAVVQAGSRITAGSHIGFVGDSGNARGTKPHLHFSVRKGSQLVNPYSYLQGSRNAGNYYAPGSPQAIGDPMKRKYNALINAVSNRVAGPDGRVDYRSLMLNPEEEEGEAIDIVDEGRPPQRKVQSGERGMY